MITRRAFLETVAAAAAFPAWRPQSGPACEWGSPVFDLHFHLRPQPANNLAHLDGAGVTKANLLTRGARRSIRSRRWRLRRRVGSRGSTAPTSRSRRPKRR